MLNFIYWLIGIPSDWDSDEAKDKWYSQRMEDLADGDD